MLFRSDGFAEQHSGHDRIARIMTLEERELRFYQERTAGPGLGDLENLVDEEKGRAVRNASVNFFHDEMGTRVGVASGNCKGGVLARVGRSFGGRQFSPEKAIDFVGSYNAVVNGA